MNVNRDWWDERAALHGQDQVYDTASFLAGSSTLYDLDRGVLGDLAGQNVVHLQCHTGMDTLPLLRAGARRVTGVDFSAVAVATATGTAAAGAGLVVEQLGEHVAVESDFGRGLLPRDADGLLRWRRDGELLPVIFSLRARKPG